jgi:hypothetical protein
MQLERSFALCCDLWVSFHPEKEEWLSGRFSFYLCQKIFRALARAAIPKLSPMFQPEGLEAE